MIFVLHITVLSTSAKYAQFSFQYVTSPVLQYVELLQSCGQVMAIDGTVARSQGERCTLFGHWLRPLIVQVVAGTDWSCTILGTSPSATGTSPSGVCARPKHTCRNVGTPVARANRLLLGLGQLQVRTCTGRIGETLIISLSREKSREWKLCLPYLIGSFWFTDWFPDFMVWNEGCAQWRDLLLRSGRRRVAQLTSGALSLPFACDSSSFLRIRVFYASHEKRQLHIPSLSFPVEFECRVQTQIFRFRTNFRSRILYSLELSRFELNDEFHGRLNDMSLSDYEFNDGRGIPCLPFCDTLDPHLLFQLFS